MGKLRVLFIGLFSAFSVFSFLYNIVNPLFHFFPDLGAVGSWLFNPLGMLFSNILGNAISANISSNLGFLGGLIHDSTMGFSIWLAGGLLAIAGIVGSAIISLLLVGFRPQKPFKR